MIDFLRADQEFQSYLDGYDREDPKIKLKIIHTYGVIACADAIAARMKLSEEDRELARLIALLHDIGRFEQVKCFDSFQPDTMDHASYGAELLFGEQKLIRRFVEEETWDAMIETAIAKHSDYRLEGISDERTLLHAKLIRDADKLDNCRVKLEDSLQILLGCSGEEAGTYPISDKVWEDCMQKKSIYSPDRKTPMDYWVSYVAYFFDVNFPETFAILREEDYVARTVHRIPCSREDTREKMEQLCSLMQEYVSARADHICTYTKVHFTPLEPVLEEIKIEDISHALSLMTRANGHFPEFYSVAQHCIHCAREAQAEGLSDRMILACLLHDASEAYMADMIRPVKKYLSEYLTIEKRLLNAIYLRFLGSALTEEEQKIVKRIDDSLLYYEFYHYMGEYLAETAPKLWSHPVFETRPFQEVEEEYRKIFEALQKKRGVV